MSTVDKIKDLCISKDITPTELERILGFGKGVIRNWDKVSPTSDKLKRVADYFNVTTDYLLGRSDQSKIVYDEELTEDEKTAVKAFLDTFRKMKKSK
ncbi:helix-turn-helix transcriptional regulator [Clostridium sp. BNL1100]|uniref:helix-turn-helix domain-containing protein n=1 Tax=Clostridium sp. BNL1100 TaxID=755731 RepID=UPI00024A7DC2|nr:helix-turn-helix transcriptional regulator [Clostridium sp. BNL1100]AEY65383.1 hypothetical protein Clo1100_1131 [Clostridium sp. BNL1100]